ncbi:hypothetical protein F383_26742 [Gossypium arboreum]|uniref:Uncharacterized protein n=1 Tax=Gossypium arboreum TaxID=29729 RepID=A0A0B0PD46_GOSAR|nr:hypothetical protein F383_26742 [Gossypium arboreum]
MELFQGKAMVPQDDLSSASTLQKDLRVHNFICAPMLPRRPRVLRWEALLGEQLKINVDAA